MPTTVPTRVPARIAWPAHARGLMPMPAARMRPAAISPSWCTAAGGTPERDDDDSSGDGDLHGSRCHAAPLPGQRSYAWDGARKLSRRYRPGSASPDS